MSNIIDQFNNPVTLDDNELIIKFQKLQALKKEIDIFDKLFKEEIQLRGDSQENKVGEFELVYKSSNLFNKPKAEEFAEQIGLLDDFRTEIDYKRLQSYIKSLGKYDEFTVQGKPQMNVKKVQKE